MEQWFTVSETEACRGRDCWALSSIRQGWFFVEVSRVWILSS